MPGPDPLSEQYPARSDPSNAWQALAHAAGSPPVDAELRSLYADLDDQIARRGPTCWTSGRCCNFDRFGHRLYVTALEIAWFLPQAGPPPESDPANKPTEPVEPPRASEAAIGQPIQLPQLNAAGPPLSEACPYQLKGRCSTHTVRPLGCRVFFCQAGTEDWQQQLYEHFLDRLRKLHDDHAIPYRYLEWRAGLREAMAARCDQSGPCPNSRDPRTGEV